ncbi:ATP-grasp domain-containing protein [Lutibacter sp.]|uniref:ATP-grasp domain-containing protein n=1 Tax=Lutibacter sp. TaxID=1925666 RepID=UPI003569FDB4
MILIDKPYASDFLIQTIKESNFEIIATEAAKLMIADPSLNWVSEQKAIQKIKDNPTIPIYSNSENSIGWVEEHLHFTKLPQQISLFKNKLKFRALIADIFPEYFFKGIKFTDLKNINVHHLKFPFIIKPTVGFFSIAVHKVDSAKEWESVLNAIENEVSNFKSHYPKQVIDITDFIIEEYIDGEEYAVDCYFNNKGEPVILNVLHHIFSSANDVSDRVYSTSKTIIETYFTQIQSFLQLIGKKANLKNFPIHIEIRVNPEGKVYPIEVNPLRFGGWCTTGDLAWYAYGINSYEYFLKGKKPDWNEIFKTRESQKYSIVLLDNGLGIPENTISHFDFEKLLKDFKKPLTLRKTDFKKYPIFGFVFVETTAENEHELSTILTSDLQKYIILKSRVNNESN